MIEQEEKLLDISIICWLSGDTKPAFQWDLLHHFSTFAPAVFI